MKCLLRAQAVQFTQPRRVLCEPTSQIRDSANGSDAAFDLPGSQRRTATYIQGFWDMKRWQVIVAAALLAGCAGTQPGDGVEDTTTTTSTTLPIGGAVSGAGSGDQGGSEPDDDLPEPADEDDTDLSGTETADEEPQWSGRITVGEVVYDLEIEWCEIDELDLTIGGGVQERSDSLFEIDRIEDPFFGLEDLAWVIIGNPDAPEIYWEASVISQEEMGADVLFLEIDEQMVTADAWFEDRREPTSGETIIDGDIVAGTIEVTC